MRRTIIAFAAIVLGAGALAGCREEEQGRPLAVDKGRYKGPADTALSKAQVDRLTDRAALQGNIGSSTLAGGGSSPADRAPQKIQGRVPDSSGPLLEKTLSDRLRLQDN